MAETTPGDESESQPQSASPAVVPASASPAAGRKSLPSALYETAIDVSNEAIVQSANLFLMARRVLLTSLGAVTMTLEEANEFVERLVDRGEVAETELTRIVNEYIERSNLRENGAMETRRATVDKAAVALADSVEVILGRLNVPTRSDIEELSRKISQLNDKVMALKSQRAAAAASAAPPQPQEPQPPEPQSHEPQSLKTNGG